jgi:tRNA pseudouridine55 synthase
MTGLLLLDKPPGVTSFTAANRARRALGAKKAGHTGTLDPMATGVLPILLGGATRFGAYLPCNEKEYVAAFRLGITTDTLDTTGEVLRESPVTAGRAEVEAALAAFRGRILQVPPMYSAISQNGVRLYELARQGKTVERAAREVEIYALELCPAAEEVSANEYTLRAHCSAGTYIRTLIDDLGRALGCGAAMSGLRRTMANGFGIERCVAMEELEQRGTACVSPIDAALAAYPAVEVTQPQARRFANGGALDLLRLNGNLDVLAEGSLKLVYDPEGRFLGLGKVQGEQLAPAVVIGGEA